MDRVRFSAFACPAPVRARLRASRSRGRACVFAVCPTFGSNSCLETARWARTVVVGLGLCPFAAGALEDNGARFCEYNATDALDAEKALWAEVEHLAKSENTTTTLMVLPYFAATEFRRWHAFTSSMERKVEHDSDLFEQVLLACFHPEHTWGGEEERSPIHFDRRAPYPTINILRAPQVDEAAEQGKTKGILQRNQDTLHSVGYDELVRIFTNLKVNETGSKNNLGPV